MYQKRFRHLNLCIYYLSSLHNYEEIPIEELDLDLVPLTFVPDVLVYTKRQDPLPFLDLDPIPLQLKADLGMEDLLFLSG